MKEFDSQFNPSWSEVDTLETWMKKVLSHSRDHDLEVIALMKVLPEEKKEYYREIWKTFRNKS